MNHFLSFLRGFASGSKAFSFSRNFFLSFRTENLRHGSPLRVKLRFYFIACWARWGPKRKVSTICDTPAMQFRRQPFGIQRTAGRLRQGAMRQQHWQ